MLSDAKSSLGDAERLRGDTKSSLGAVQATVLLHDEPCYRVEYDAAGLLSLQLMEGGPDKSELSLGAMDTAFADYLSVFLQSQTGAAADKSGVFLSRNLQVRHAPAAGGCAAGSWWMGKLRKLEQCAGAGAARRVGGQLTRREQRRRPTAGCTLRLA